MLSNKANGELFYTEHIHVHAYSCTPLHHTEHNIKNVFITHRMDFCQTSVNRDLFQNIKAKRLLAYQSSHELVQWYIYPIDKTKLANGYLRKTHITVLNINLETNCNREEIVFMNL